MSDTAWARPAAGREPAAAALLGWLADASAPGLCLVAGSEGCGKSTLLAWLVGHGTRPGTVPERTVHAFVPLEGQSMRGTVWMLADQLGLVARAPDELLAGLGADPRPVTIVLPGLHASSDSEALAELALALCGIGHVRVVVEARSQSTVHRPLAASGGAVMDLDEPQWTDEARYQAWMATQDAAGHSAHTTGQQTVAALALDDAAALCAADPWQVTAAFENGADEHGGLRAAWLRAGQSLCRDQEPAERALVLLAALGDGADPRLGPELRSLATTAGWQVQWSRVRGDVTPPWPGPVLALAQGPGLAPCQGLMADHQGVLKTISTADGAPAGRLAQPVAQPTAVTVLDDATVLALDAQGRLHTRTLPTAPRVTGIAALLDDGPTPTERLTQALSAQLDRSPGTAIAATTSIASIGDATGAVRVFPVGSAQDRQHVAQLHTGRVTALSALEIPLGGDGATVALLYSGGADGTVRAWAPVADPQQTPVTQRRCAVSALSAARTPSGLVLAIGWADGLIELHRLDGGPTRLFRPGPPVNALALTAKEYLLIGLDDRVLCLRPN
ncbi:hypothetical protein [Streptomyces sp. NPDC005408]|uniref:hypothetical protein n=1 Tax=Streptomyces sp. NPDC005408 TaxID=3155341 RepID=UPI0033A8C393